MPSSALVTHLFSSLMRVYRSFPPLAPIGLTRRRTTRRINRLKETFLTISPDYSDCATPDFLMHSLYRFD